MNSSHINNNNNTLDQARRGAVHHRHPPFYVLTTLCSTTLPHRRTTRPRPVLNLKRSVRPCRTLTSTRYVNHDALSMTVRPRPSGDLSLTTFTLSFSSQITHKTLCVSAPVGAQLKQGDTAANAAAVYTALDKVRIPRPLDDRSTTPLSRSFLASSILSLMHLPFRRILRVHHCAE